MAWVNGTLLDVAGGWRDLLGGPGPGTVFHDGPFDWAVASPRGGLCALVASAGTTGLLLGSDGAVVRELTRSPSHADTYRYPIAFCTLPDGRTGLVHCPDEHNRLEVEVAATGERLTVDPDRAPEDVFHSRPAVSADGALLLSAGWLRHPFGTLQVFDLTRALAEPRVLDGWGDVFGPGFAAEIAGACFVGRDVVLSTSDAPGLQASSELAPNTLAKWSTTGQRYVWRYALDASPGDLVALGRDVLALNGHPRLYDGADGHLVQEWPNLPTGESTSAITGADTFRGPGRVAVDPASRRFAYTDGEQVVVVTLD